MNLFFVYDVTYCKADEDDPKDAIIYFFHSQATDSEHYLLCCQLVGVAKFLKATFSIPSIIVVDQGKFAFHWSGKYLLVLGDSSDIQSKVLKDQLSFLCGLFCFYHGSINDMQKICKNRKEFLAKLEIAWSRYLSLSQCFGNILQFSMSALPLTAFKKSSALVSKANRLLQMCQMSSSVMAGAVYYNSRVLASQLTPQLTNYLTLMSNSNASTPVDNASLNVKNLPPDVEIKHVYLSTAVIAKILKYNHGFVGSRIRVKTNKISPTFCSLPTYYEHFNSGSDADIDSGNCSESLLSSNKKSDSMFYSGKKSSLAFWPNSRNSFIKKPKLVSSCCYFHWRLLKKKLLSGRNQNCIKFIYEANPAFSENKNIETEDSEVHSRIKKENFNLEEKLQEYQGIGVNVLCLDHAELQILSVFSDIKEKHSNGVSTCDSEFSCTLCLDKKYASNPLSLKNWNSEEDLTCAKLFKPPRHWFDNILSGSHILRSEKRRHSGSIKRSKIQVLKCRSKSESSSSSVHRTKADQLFNRNHSQDLLISNSEINVSNSKNTIGNESYLNIESNDLQKHVIYVHRYGGSTLILLFNKGFNEDIITYLWNCGFSILRDIQYCAEKVSSDNVHIDPSFYIMLYNSSQKVLKEYPYYPSVLLTERRVRKAVQSLQAEFQMDPLVHSFNLLSAYQSIYASHKDKYFTFYIQPESNTRKVETLTNLSKKALRRLEKVFKISQ